MTKASRLSWSIVAMVAFAAINLLAIYYAATTHPIDGLSDTRLDFAISNLDWLTMLVLALGIYRLTDIVVFEKVCEPFRMLFTDMGPDNSRRASTKGLKGFLAQLFGCNSCTGVWMAMAVVYLFVFFPQPTFIFMVIIALTGFERFFSKIYNFLERK